MAKEITVLRVPIRVDALYVCTGTLPLGLPMADFSQLPYYLSDGTTTINAQPPTPNLASVEAAFPPELGSAGNALAFPSGLHLHWALPDALTTGRHRGGGTQFPPVPNRWLVRRLTDKGVLQKSWIVESDFLHPCDGTDKPICDPPPNDGSGNPITAWPGGRPITFATKRRKFSNYTGGAAYRYMGRSRLLQDWLKTPSSKNDAYLNQDTYSDHKLTALGYGEPAFAAYYPNCYSVFGFCDVDLGLQGDTSYEYQVVGWFHEADLDPLQSAEYAGPAKNAEHYAALQREYRWCVSAADAKKTFPVRMVCYASLTLVPNHVTPWKSQDAVDIAIGNTGGEALSALLADQIAAESSDKLTIEDQLEAVNLAPQLQGVEIDYPAHFAQTRHQRGFRGIAGGNRWAVIPRRKRTVSAAAATRDAAPLPPLPVAVAHALNALNSAQDAYDMAQQEIAELRYQTFCDWHKFLDAFNSNASALTPFHSASVMDFLERQPLALLNKKIGHAGTLSVTSKRGKSDLPSGSGLLTVVATANPPRTTLDLSTNTLTPAHPANTTLAVQVVLRLKALADTLIAAKITSHYEIANHSAEHFWRPREPVVLLSGPVAISTPRHGEDGDLACAVLDMPDVPGTAAFIAAIDTLKPASLDDRDSPSQPWHPIILEWSVSVKPMKAGRTANPNVTGTLDYQPTFLTNSFTLAENEPDYSLPEGLPLLDRNIYEGRCLMTPTAGTQLGTNLGTFLMKATLDDCRDRTAKASDYLDLLITWYRTKHPDIAPPTKGAEKSWLKQRKPFVEKEKGGPRLFPADDLKTWYADKPVAEPAHTFSHLNPAQQAQDPIFSAIRALSQLQGKSSAGGMRILSQALGGFNAALLTRKQALQIPIEDPIGDGAGQPLGTLTCPDLTSAVASAVGRHHPTAPLDDLVFSPIRSGTLALESLRLIDTFGQQWNATLAGARPVISSGLADPKESSDTAYLQPRFTAPARLNFHWLAALSGQNGVDEVQMNSVPATTPVCGWLLPNNFDGSVMVYDNTGKALGSIDMMAQWFPAPGSSDRLAAGEIPNPHLRRLVRRLVVDVNTPPADSKVRRQFMNGFLSTLDSAIETIEPASFAQHEALALLIGRPIAVVRARVDLQLMGQPTHLETIDDPTIPGCKALRLRKSRHWKAFADQGWAAFGYDINQFESKTPDYARTTHGFEKVAIPVRLGEHQLLNDGLVGFWKETAEGELDNVFNAPQTLDSSKIEEEVTYQDGRTTPCIRALGAGAWNNLSLTLQDDPLALTILMDPRGVLHATSGLMPVYQLEIPSAYYADALSRMAVTFRISPVLTDAEQFHAALPKEAGNVWSWLTRPNGSTWDETNTIVDATEHAHFFKVPEIVEGWLKLTPKNKG
jgi:hypothetical protein